MKRLILIILTVSLFFSCKRKEPDTMEIINVTIFSIDEYNYTGYFKEDANISSIPDSEVTGLYNISVTPYEKWVFSYKAPFDFTGIESFTIYSKRIDKQDPDQLIADSMKIIIEVIIDDFPDKLIGNWRYIQSCGGYDGGCWTENPNGFNEISFTADMTYTSYIDGILYESFHYEFVDGIRIGEKAIYTVRFDNEYETYYWFSNDRLLIQGGDYVDEYERIE